MASLDFDRYIDAANRESTKRSYAGAVRHFKIEWKGFLPATPDSVARYLAHYAESLALNTLQQRLVALTQWHNEQGFPDPTKFPVVRIVLKGIRIPCRQVYGPSVAPGLCQLGNRKRLGSQITHGVLMYILLCDTWKL